MSNELPKEVIEKIEAKANEAFPYVVQGDEFRRYDANYDERRGCIRGMKEALTDPEVLAMAGLVKKKDYKPIVDGWEDDLIKLNAAQKRIKELVGGIEILETLVDLKNTKDTIGETADYFKRKPQAWNRARNFLNQLKQ